MRGTLAFDPEQHDYGPASPQIRGAIHAYAKIDWFEPWGDLHAAQQAFEHHQRLAHGHQPELFPARQRLELLEGTWVEFGEYCETVRKPDTGWDWRMTALKSLTQLHSATHGWRLAAQPATRAESRPGELYMNLHGLAVWLQVWPRVALDGDGAWYASYTHADLLDAIQWWLAEPTAIDNPFVPLIRCYQLGVYPFSLAKDHVVLFAFRAAPAKLPTARLVR